MDGISKTLQNLSQKQKIALLLFFILMVLLSVAVTAAPKARRTDSSAFSDFSDVKKARYQTD